jgi:hypothetical protein
MIADILKEKTPETKPRFFLHDEVKAWLHDNLEIRIKVLPSYSTNWDMQSKLQNLGFYRPIITSFMLQTNVTIAGETAAYIESDSILASTEDLTALVLAQNQIMKEEFTKLYTENEKLKERIYYLETRPV